MEISNLFSQCINSTKKKQIRTNTETLKYMREDALISGLAYLDLLWFLIVIRLVII